MKFDKKEIFSIPNLMSYFRILLIPVFAYVYLTATTKVEFYFALAILLLSGLSDLLDGVVARKFHMVTRLGKILDPVADKITLGVVFLCMAIRIPLLWFLFLLLVIKECYMAIMGAYFMKQGKMLDGAMWFGKIGTATQYLTLYLLLIFPMMTTSTRTAIIVICAGVMVYTLVKYVFVFSRMKREN